MGYNPSYKWINPTNYYPIYNWGYNPLTKWDEPPSWASPTKSGPANQTHGAGFTLQCSLPKKLQTLVLRRQSGVFKRPKVPKPRRQMGSLVVRMTKNHPKISKVHENLWLRHFDVKEPLLRSFRRPSAVKYRKPRRVASGRNLLDLGGQGLANLMGILNALYLNIRKYHLKYQEPCGKWTTMS
jgi:hypothetical protein